MKPVFPLLEEQQIEYLIYYPELFSAEDRRRVEKVLMLQGDLVGEGNTPSAFQIYTAYAPKNFTESPYASSINLEIITSASYQEPLQILGNGIFLETTPIRKKREIMLGGARRAQVWAHAPRIPTLPRGRPAPEQPPAPGQPRWPSGRGCRKWRTPPRGAPDVNEDDEEDEDDEDDDDE